MTSQAAAVAAFFERVAAGEFERMPEYLSPDVVWFGTRGGLDEDQVVRGPDAVLEYMREIAEPWERIEVEVERLVEAGDAVVVFLREIAQARHGGPELGDETAMVIKVRGAKIVEMTGYLDRDEALRAARSGD